MLFNGILFSESIMVLNICVWSVLGTYLTCALTQHSSPLYTCPYIYIASLPSSVLCLGCSILPVKSQTYKHCIQALQYHPLCQRIILCIRANVLI